MPAWEIVVISVLITLVITGVINKVYRRKVNKEMTELLLSVVSLLFDCASKAGYTSALEYMDKEMGRKYTITLMGRIYSLLNVFGKQADDKWKVKNAIEEYLKVELASDIAEYKEKKEGGTGNACNQQGDFNRSKRKEVCSRGV